MVKTPIIKIGIESLKYFFIYAKQNTDLHANKKLFCHFALKPAVSKTCVDVFKLHFSPVFSSFGSASDIINLSSDKKLQNVVCTQLS